VLTRVDTSMHVNGHSMNEALRYGVIENFLVKSRHGLRYCVWLQFLFLYFSNHITVNI